MDINDLKIALADLYLINLEKSKKIDQLTKAGETLYKENEQLKQEKADASVQLADES